MLINFLRPIVYDKCIILHVYARKEKNTRVQFSLSGDSFERKPLYVVVFAKHKGNIFDISDIAGGYLCFIISILGIGVVTAIIGDVASYFGCTLGIKDSVTAIVFVALGTSIPGKCLKTGDNVCTGRKGDIGRERSY